METNCPQPLPEHIVPTTEAAVAMYQCEGGTLTQDLVVGKDLLESSPTLQERRDKQFLSENCISRIFLHAVNDNPKPFKAGLKSFIRITNRIHDLQL